MTLQPPEPGDVWTTPHGVRMSVPAVGAPSPYIRLDYRLGGHLLTVAVLAEKWLIARTEQWSTSYRASPRDLVTRRIIPGLGSVRVADLTREHTSALILAQASTSGRVSMHRALQVPRTYTAQRTRKAYTYPGHYALMFLVAAFCGLRQGEIWALRAEDVQGDVLKVRHQLVWVGNTPHFTLPKNGKQREVYIASQPAEFPLRQMLADRAAEVGPGGLLFKTGGGSLFRRGNFSRDVMGPLREVAWPGKRWTFHGLRHHFCRWMLDVGADLKDVSEAAGHSNTLITATLYVSANDRRMDRARALEARHAQTAPET